MAKSPAAVFKSKGFIPKSWDLRKPLTDYKKRIIRKLQREYSDILDRPQDYQIRKVSEKTRKLAEAAGYRSVRDRLIIPARKKKTSEGTIGFESVSISRKMIVTRYSDRTETVYLSSAPDFLKTVDRLLAQEEEFGDEDGVFWAFKIGESNTFINSKKTLEELLYSYAPKLNFRGDPTKMAMMTNLVRIEYHSGKTFNQGAAGPLER